MQAHAQIEPLEQRTLLSAWTTQDDFMPFTPGPASYAINYGLTADASGNVYAVGEANDGQANQNFAIVRRKTSDGADWQTVGTVAGPVGNFPPTAFTALAVAPSGDVYAVGYLNSNARIWKGTWTGDSLSFSVLDSQDNFTHYADIDIDASGNVFVVGSVSVRQGKSNTAHWIVRKQTGGQGAFTTVSDFLYNGLGSRATALEIVDSGSAAGVYVVGSGGAGTTAGATWIVRKSTNGGTAWVNADAFQLDPATHASSVANDIAVHEDGRIFVAGIAATGVRTGGTNNKPVYTYTDRWFMRSSANGGGAWSSDVVYPGTIYDNANITTDVAGNVYIAGTQSVGGADHSIVRTNTGGTWSTSDDYAYVAGSYGAQSSAIARDTSGNIYVGGSVSPADAPYRWFVRSMTPALAVGSPSTIFSISKMHRDPLFDVTALSDELLA